MFDCFDSYEGNNEDSRALKKDQEYHARTAFESLKRFGRTLATTPTDTVERARLERQLRDPYQRAPNRRQYWQKPSFYVRDRVEEMQGWLLSHSHEIPSEVENEKGQTSGRTTFEIPETYLSTEAKDQVGEFEADEQSDTLSKYERHGLQHVERLGRYEPLDGVVKSMADKADKETAEIIRANPTSWPVVRRALKIRGRRFERHMTARAKQLRWSGMEEFNAVTKALEKIDAGAERTRATSNAKPLPCIGRLAELFDVRDGVLYRTRLGRPVDKAKVKIDGGVYTTARILYALETGEDPADRIVKGGEATEYRKATGTVMYRGDSKFDAIVQLDNGAVTVGEYRTEAQATEAARLYLRTFERWG